MNFTAIQYGARLEEYIKDARDLVQAFKSRDPKAMYLVKRYDPRLPGRANTNDRNHVTEAEIRRVKLSLVDAQNIIARGHQFESWGQFAKHIAALNQKGSPVWQFETGVHAIVTGDAPTCCANSRRSCRAPSSRRRVASSGSSTGV